TITTATKPAILNYLNYRVWKEKSDTFVCNSFFANDTINVNNLFNNFFLPRLSYFIILLQNI
ncbi:hypothetical protein L9F63_016187, partial [Diploptera punctata]